MRPFILSFTLVFLVTGQAFAQKAQKETLGSKPDQVVLAKVNETIITMGDFREALSALPPQQQVMALNSRKEFLDSLVKREIVFQEAMRRGLDRDPTVASLLAKLKKEVVIQALLREVIKDAQAVTDADSERFYLENKEHFKTPEKITASHIVVKTKEEAKDALAALKEGKSFATLAKERSIGPRAAQGGYLGSITRGEMPQEFDRVAFDLSVGSTSDVVTTSFGYHIIKVTDHIAPEQMGFKEVSGQIRQRLRAKRQQDAARAFLEEITKNASVETHPENLARQKP